MVSKEIYLLGEVSLSGKKNFLRVEERIDGNLQEDRNLEE